MQGLLRQREARGEATGNEREPRAEIFRPSPWLRATVAVAACFWIFVFFLLVSLQNATGRDYLSTAFFIALFTFIGVVYNNLSIEVTGDALIYRGILSFSRIPFADIRKVEAKAGLLQTTYRVLARRSLVSFTSLFSGHRRLMALIVERAGLAHQT